MRPALRLLVVFCLGLVGGLAGETLLVLKRHCAGIEAALQEDFRVLAFLRDSSEPARLKIIEEKLRALPDVEEALFVSRDESLSRLRAQDPVLVEAVTWLGENPLPQAFELKLAPGSLGRFPQWLAASASVSEWVELRYKPGQVRAILQVQFYGHFIGVVVGAAFCAAALVVMALFWGAGPGLFSSRQGAAALASSGGAAAGMALAYAAVYPMRHYFPWWAPPPALAQSLLLLGASLLGWVFCPWLPSD